MVVRLVDPWPTRLEFPANPRTLPAEGAGRVVVPGVGNRTLPTSPGGGSTCDGSRSFSLFYPSALQYSRPLPKHPTKSLFRNLLPITSLFPVPCTGNPSYLQQNKRFEGGEGYPSLRGVVRDLSPWLRSRCRTHPSTLTRTIFFPARSVNSEPSFTEATRSLVGAPSSFTAFCLTLREPSETEVARPGWKTSWSRRTWTVVLFDPTLSPTKGDKGGAPGGGVGRRKCPLKLRLGAPRGSGIREAKPPMESDMSQGTANIGCAREHPGQRVRIAKPGA